MTAAMERKRKSRERRRLGLRPVQVELSEQVIDFLLARKTSWSAPTMARLDRRCRPSCPMRCWSGDDAGRGGEAAAPATAAAKVLCQEAGASNLMELKVEFEAVDFPQAKRLTIHIMAPSPTMQRRNQLSQCNVSAACSRNRRPAPGRTRVVESGDAGHQRPWCNSATPP